MKNKESTQRIAKDFINSLPFNLHQPLYIIESDRVLHTSQKKPQSNCNICHGSGKITIEGKKTAYDCPACTGVEYEYRVTWYNSKSAEIKKFIIGENAEIYVSVGYQSLEIPISIINKDEFYKDCMFFTDENKMQNKLRELIDER